MRDHLHIHCGVDAVNVSRLPHANKFWRLPAFAVILAKDPDNRAI
jgi:hypothetical protein